MHFGIFQYRYIYIYILRRWALSFNIDRRLPVLVNLKQQRYRISKYWYSFSDTGILKQAMWFDFDTL